jgi:hypothetical protein
MTRKRPEGVGGSAPHHGDGVFLMFRRGNRSGMLLETPRLFSGAICESAFRVQLLGSRKKV